MELKVKLRELGNDAYVLELDESGLEALHTSLWRHVRRDHVNELPFGPIDMETLRKMDLNILPGWAHLNVAKPFDSPSEAQSHIAEVIEAEKERRGLTGTFEEDPDERLKKFDEDQKTELEKLIRERREKFDEAQKAMLNRLKRPHFSSQLEAQAHIAATYGKFGSSPQSGSVRYHKFGQRNDDFTAQPGARDEAKEASLRCRREFIATTFLSGNWEHLQHRFATSEIIRVSLEVADALIASIDGKTDTSKGVSTP